MYRGTAGLFDPFGQGERPGGIRKPPKMTTGWPRRDVPITGSTHIAGH